MKRKTEKKIENIDNVLGLMVVQLKKKLLEYEKQFNKPYKVQLKEDNDYDYINPQHYVGDDGRQTWERMVEKWGVEKTALWCEMTAFKYIDTRIGKKPNEDSEREMKKVKWYEDKAKELYKNGSL